MVHKMCSLDQQHQLSPGNLFEIRILGSHTRPPKPETLRVGPSNVCSHKLSDTQKSENQWSGEQYGAPSGCYWLIFFNLLSFLFFSLLPLVITHFSFLLQKKFSKELSMSPSLLFPFFLQAALTRVSAHVHWDCSCQVCNDLYVATSNDHQSEPLTVLIIPYFLIHMYFLHFSLGPHTFWDFLLLPGCSISGFFVTFSFPSSPLMLEWSRVEHLILFYPPSHSLLGNHICSLL